MMQGVLATPPPPPPRHVIRKGGGAARGGAAAASVIDEAEQRAIAERLPRRLPRGAAAAAAAAASARWRRDRRSSPIVEISRLLAECVQHGLRTIAFCKTRKTCELVVSYTREVRGGTCASAKPCSGGVCWRLRVGCLLKHDRNRAYVYA